MSWLQRGKVILLGRYGARLRFPHLLLLTAALFLADLLIPDGLPFMDEAFLGLLTLLFASWRNRRIQDRDPEEGLDRY
ncbi:MAG TPA: hypothetical protein ENI85_17280 [Deltaproteobacteria bacterium]|nr:hypothetical protein [Deltaproteobacteria bacterium]